MRIGKGEGVVACNSNAAAKWRKARHIGHRIEALRRRPDMFQRGKIDMSFYDICGMVEEMLQIGVFARLHKPQMAFRQNQCNIARQCSQNRNAQRLEGIAQHGFMTSATDTIKHQACNEHVLAEPAEAGNQRGNGMGLFCAIDHQHYRQIEQLCQISRRTLPVQSAVEKDPSCLRRSALFRLRSFGPTGR